MPNPIEVFSVELTASHQQNLQDLVNAKSAANTPTDIVSHTHDDTVLNARLAVIKAAGQYLLDRLDQDNHPDAQLKPVKLFHYFRNKYKDGRINAIALFKIALEDTTTPEMLEQAIATATRFSSDSEQSLNKYLAIQFGLVSQEASSQMLKAAAKQIKRSPPACSSQRPPMRDAPRLLDDPSEASSPPTPEIIAAFHKAVSENDINTVIRILESGVNPSEMTFSFLPLFSDHHGNILHAIASGVFPSADRKEMIALLINRCPELALQVDTIFQQTPFATAIAWSQNSVTASLQHATPVDIQAILNQHIGGNGTRYSNNPLTLAVERLPLSPENIKLIKYLIDNGADPNLRIEKDGQAGFSALEWAAVMKRLDVMAVLTKQDPSTTAIAGYPREIQALYHRTVDVHRAALTRQVRQTHLGSVPVVNTVADQRYLDAVAHYFDRPELLIDYMVYQDNLSKLKVEMSDKQKQSVQELYQGHALSHLFEKDKTQGLGMFSSRFNIARNSPGSMLRAFEKMPLLGDAAETAVEKIFSGQCSCVADRVPKRLQVIRSSVPSHRPSI